MNKTRDALAAKITENMTKEPVSCIKAPGYPADGKDNDCNSRIDDDISCDYSDMIGVSGLFEKDCKCSPPVLNVASISDQTLMCTEPRGPKVLGRPSITFWNASVTGCPNNQGQFELQNDIVLGDGLKCGAGVIKREHGMYIVGFYTSFFLL